MSEAVQYQFDPTPGPRLDALAAFGNKIEFEADEQGMVLLEQAGFDPHDMVRALEKLSHYPLLGKAVKDHPLTVDRYKRLQQILADGDSI